MSEFSAVAQSLAHTGHSHGPNTAVIALLIALLALGAAAVAGAIHRDRRHAVNQQNETETNNAGSRAVDRRVR